MNKSAYQPQLLTGYSVGGFQHPIVQYQVKYQAFALCIALVAAGFTLLLRPESRRFLKWGDLGVVASEIKWLGIDGNRAWKRTSLEMGAVISVATAVFMYFAVKNNPGAWQSILANWHWIVLFSALNALSEELICRFGVVGQLSGIAGKNAILLISGVIFGLAHYNGYPNGFIGVAMAGFLGWILARSVVETEGLGIAWSIHFVQDVIIFTGLFAMNP